MNNNSKKSQILKRLLNKTVTKPFDEEASNSRINLDRNLNEIPRAIEQPYYPASFAQKRMFLLHQIEPLSVSYNLPLSLLIEGKFDEQRLQIAINQLIERHEAFRTGVCMIDNDIVQIIQEEIRLPLEKYSINEDKIPELMKQFSQPFDLTKAPLARIGIAEIGYERYLLLIDIHHIVADGVSLQVILHDLMLLYRGVSLQSLPIRYRDYAIWQEKWFESENKKRQEKFWNRMFEGELPVLDLPTDFSRHNFLNNVGSHVDFSFTLEQTESLKFLSMEWKITNYTVLLGGFFILLSKYTGQNDMIIGSPVAGRKNQALQGLVGLFVNTIAIRSKPIASLKVSDYIKDLQTIVFSALDAQDYPFEAVVETAEVVRNINRNPLFDVMFSMINMKKTMSDFNDLTIKSYPFERKVANFDLELYALEENNVLTFSLEYNTSIFCDDTVEQMGKHFQYVVQQIIDNPDQEISTIHLMDEIEQAETLQRYCGEKVSEDNVVLMQVIEEQVRKTPNAIAAICEDRSLTYSELNIWANRVANGLLKLGVCNEELITLWLDRELEFLTGMLGVFKASAAYVPVDPALPRERIRTILEESHSRLIITEAKYEKLAYELVGDNVKVILIEELLTIDNSSENPIISVSPENLAYVIFTSGSTGKPKGAMVEHRGMINHIRAKIIDLKLNQYDKVAETATQSFDVSVWQFMTALAAGGTTVIFKGINAWQPKLLLEGIRKHEVTVFETVPSHLSVLLDEFEENNESYKMLPLRWMMLNGEILLSELCNCWFEYYPNIPIVNAYGPTECSDDVTHYVVPNASALQHFSVPISGTVSGMHLYILDESLNLVPKGIIGELYIGGVGVGRGYIADPIKTASVFLPDIFSNELGKRMYKTGDLVRELKDGSIEFLGRNDYQLKINGMRIEINEIEHTILSTNLVRQTVVVAGKWGSTNEKQLCAYVALKQDADLTLLKNMISTTLPSHMVPIYWVGLEELPLLTNGKINRKALPEPNLKTYKGEKYIRPETKVQCFMAKLWSEVLNIEESGIGLRDDFFQLGGNSLKAMRLVSKIRSQTDVELPFTVILTESLLERFVEKFQQMKEDKHREGVVKELETSTLPILSEHKRIIQQVMQMQDSVVYNMPYQCVIEGEFDVLRAETAFREICNRHWIMKAVFTKDNSSEFTLVKDDIAPMEFSYKAVNEEDIAICWNEFFQPFSLEREVLFRMQVLSVSTFRHFLFFDSHTLGADFISKQIILRDFANFYTGTPVKPLAYDYPDYIKYCLSRASGVNGINQKSLWKNYFSNDTKRLVSQDARMLTGVGIETARTMEVEVCESILSKISKISKENSVSEHSICMAAFALALSEQFRQDKFFILSPVADRDIPEFEEVVGLLFNTVPVPQSIHSNDSFVECLKQTHQNSMKAYSQRDYPAIQLYEEYAKLDAGWNEGFFDATFVWVEPLNFDYNEIGLSVHDVASEVMARFDLRLEAFRRESTLKLIIQCRERLFLPATLEKLMGRIISVLEVMTEHTDKKIDFWRDIND